MSKTKKIILSIILILVIILTAKIAYFEMFKTCSNCGRPPIESPFSNNEKLNDPSLIYASLSSSGLCANKKGESGGCYGKFYFYSSGKYVEEVSFVGADDKVNAHPTKETLLGPDVVKKITKQIKDSGIMTKACPSQKVMDISWDYQINLDGQKISLHNPPEDCRTILYAIDDALTKEAGNNVKK